MFDKMMENQCVSIGWNDDLDFSEIYGKDSKIIDSFIDENVTNSSAKSAFKKFVTTQASQKLEISSFYTRLRREEEGDLRGVARTHGKDYSSPLL